MKQAILLAGMGFGDEGKGSITDYMVREYDSDLVVRYNGGPQTAHNVVTPEAIHHTFSQFGSGTFAGADTYISQYMLFDPLSANVEAMVLSAQGVQAPWSKLHVSNDTVIVTPYHAVMNKIRERLRGDSAHGSCGRGIGEAREDQLTNRYVIYAGDLKNRSVFEEKMEELRIYKKCSSAYMAIKHGDVSTDGIALDLIEHGFDYSKYPQIETVGPDFLNKWNAKKPVIFEGAQGVLLDETYGFAPHTTWTDTTFYNAEKLVRQTEYPVKVKKYGITRTYSTRHGYGPFPTEDPTWNLPEKYNKIGSWQGGWRVGPLDLVLLRYAINKAEPDALIVTHIDTYPTTVCTAYRYKDECVSTKDRYIYTIHHPEYWERWYTETTPVLTPVTHIQDQIEAATGLPVILGSFGPQAGMKVRYFGSDRVLHAT
jgi:adenylosuccinate synthase